MGRCHRSNTPEGKPCRSTDSEKTESCAYSVPTLFRRPAFCWKKHFIRTGPEDGTGARHHRAGGTHLSRIRGGCLAGGVGNGSGHCRLSSPASKIKSNHRVGGWETKIPWRLAGALLACLAVSGAAARAVKEASAGLCQRRPLLAALHVKARKEGPVREKDDHSRHGLSFMPRSD